jgi:isochorismate synthase
MTLDLPEKLDSLIGQNRSFALCRTPLNNHIQLLRQEKKTPGRLLRIDELNGQCGFVVAPFQASEDCPIVLIQPDSNERIPLPPADPPLPAANGPLRQPTPTDAAYAERFRTFMTALRDERFHKLVLSRKTTIRRDENFSPANAFFRACHRFAHSYTYLLHTPYTGTWIGCTPELLLAGENTHWSTVALAGTQTLLPGAGPAPWDKKNITEQRLVARYVQSQLASLGIPAEENGPYTLKAGRLAHLQTDFRFILPDTRQLGSLLNLIHPTPAVSGLPKEEACRFIRANEGYNRRYYSGFVGWIDTAARSDLYVNLRCMNIRPGSLTLYAGGGLLASSLPEKEWMETECKLHTMLSIL